LAGGQLLPDPETGSWTIKVNIELELIFMHRKWK